MCAIISNYCKSSSCERYFVAEPSPPPRRVFTYAAQTSVAQLLLDAATLHAARQAVANERSTGSDETSDDGPIQTRQGRAGERAVFFTAVAVPMLLVLLLLSYKYTASVQMQLLCG